MPVHYQHVPMPMALSFTCDGCNELFESMQRAVRVNHKFSIYANADLSGEHLGFVLCEDCFLALATELTGISPQNLRAERMATLRKRLQEIGAKKRGKSVRN